MYIYVLQLEIQLSKGEGGDPIKWYNPPTICTCHKPGPGFLTSYIIVTSLFFMFNVLRSEVNACFVDIGGIVDHHCLNFLFIIEQLKVKYTPCPCMCKKIEGYT